MQMKNKLPPLNSLNTFSIAGKRLGFSKAAEELSITLSPGPANIVCTMAGIKQGIKKSIPLITGINVVYIKQKNNKKYWKFIDFIQIIKRPL
jgi:hypothetical protein